jgi:hypothetical protein
MNGELKAKLFSRLNIEEHDDDTEQDIEQIIANIQVQKIKALTTTQGSVDWKYLRRFSFTSASSYDVIKQCSGNLWHLYEYRHHWYLHGSFPMNFDESNAQQQEESTQ